MQPNSDNSKKPTSETRPVPAAFSAANRSRERHLIERGTCHVCFSYDIGYSIDLDLAARQTAQAQRDSIKHRRAAPRYFEYQPAPVRVSQPAESLPLGSCATRPHVDCVIYDFGAISVVYEIDLSGPFENLAALGELLSENAALLADSRKRIDELTTRLGHAVSSPNIASFVEDYVIYQIERLTPPVSADEFVAGHAMEIAQLLRSERQQLSAQETQDALACQISFAVDDVVIIDWQAALIFDQEAEDVRAVLEFANVELLELRFLDDRLDRVVDESYRALAQRGWRSWFRLQAGASRLGRLARLQMESAVLFEEVNNALKLFGDQYLARVYRLAAQRLHIPDWDASILRKLQTVESIYGKLADYQNTRRMELLEWIIIILIALSIVLALVPGRPH